MKKFSRFLPDFIFGSIDGLVTTFAIVSGVVGASLSNVIILILGFANLFADGFSMGASNYLSTESENELIEKGQKTNGHKKPLVVALTTFSAFVVVGVIPLIAFVFDFGSQDINFKISAVLTGLAFIFVGYVKGEVTGKRKTRAIFETFLIGTLAAVIAYVVGFLLSKIA